jgi:hypothetical protein
MILITHKTRVAIAQDGWAAAAAEVVEKINLSAIAKGKCELSLTFH